jgi:cytochrome b561
MPLKNTPDRYGALAKFFHWAVVLLVILQYILIEYAQDLPQGMEKLKFYTYHKSVGITVLALAVLRLSWRWMNRVPALPRHMNTAEVWLARGSHFALYALIFAMPLSGWLMSNAQNFPVSYFGWFTLPALVTPDRSLGELMADTHETLFIVLLVVALLHVAGALKHHLWDKDDVLKRMLPFGRTSGNPDRHDRRRPI